MLHAHLNWNLFRFSCVESKHVKITSVYSTVYEQNIEEFEYLYLV